MSINIPSSGLTTVLSTSPTTYAQAPAPETASDKAVQNFMDFMKESPAEQMEDIWLAQHGLTRADLKNMSPEKRDAILKQMAADIKQQTLAKVQDKLTGTSTS